MLTEGHKNNKTLLNYYFADTYKMLRDDKTNLGDKMNKFILHNPAKYPK